MHMSYGTQPIAMEPPKGPILKRRKAGPRYLQLIKKDGQSSKHRPPTPYPWRLRQWPAPGVGTVAVPPRPPLPGIQSQTLVRARMQTSNSIRGQARLINVSARPQQTHVAPSNQQPGSTKNSSDDKTSKRANTQKDPSPDILGRGASTNTKNA